MSIGIRAQFTNGILVPLEPLELTEGAVVKLDISEETEETEESVLEATNRLLKSAPPGTWDSSPPDGAANYRHYLYGHPKEEES